MFQELLESVLKALSFVLISCSFLSWYKKEPKKIKIAQGVRACCACPTRQFSDLLVMCSLLQADKVASPILFLHEKIVLRCVQSFTLYRLFRLRLNADTLLILIHTRLQAIHSQNQSTQLSQLIINLLCLDKSDLSFFFTRTIESQQVPISTQPPNPSSMLRPEPRIGVWS